MQFSLTLFNYPQHINNEHALNFAKSVIKQNHHIGCIFLQQNSVYLASSSIIYPQQESSIIKKWHEFLAINNIIAYVCITAALKRGILDKNMADKNQLPCNIASMFRLASLGIWLSALNKTDRLISF